MSSSVNDVVHQIVLVSGCPALQTASFILEGSLWLSYFPSDLSNVFFSLDIGNDCVDISAEKHHLKTCFSESFKERDSGCSFFVTIVNNITARCPFGGFDIQLFLYFWIIEKFDHT